MRRPSLYIGAAVVGLLALLLIALFWLFETTAGARFAITGLSRAAGLEVSASGVEGRLSDHLHLSGLKVKKPKLKAEIDSLDLVWEPRRLFSRDLAVRELSISGVRIQDDAPPSAKPPKIRWPRVNWIVRRLSAEVSRLRLTGLSYRHLDQAPLELSDLSGSLSFENGLLSLPAIKLVTPGGKVSGEIVAGLWFPSLRLDLALVPAGPLQGMDFFSLQARLLPGSDPEQLSGGIALAGKDRGKQRLELTAKLGMTESVFNLSELNFSRPGRRGVLTGAGSVTLTAADPVFSLSLKSVDLDLADFLKTPTRLSGSATFKGTLSKFQGKFNLSNVGPGWQSAALAADYQGDAAGIKLAPLSGTVLQGRLRGALDVGWNRGVRVSGTLEGRGLNPASLAPDWKGVVNLNLAGNLELPPKGELRGKLSGRLLESRLHGRELQGELIAAFAGERVRVDRLLLKGRGFDLQGKGELDQRLGLVARVSDLSRLVPGAAGELQADGWVRWRDKQFSGGVKGEGSRLLVAGVRAKALQLQASLGEGKDYPVHLEATLGELSYGEAEVAATHLLLQGTVARHTLEAKLASPGSEAQLALSGGYRRGEWQGELTRFSGRDGVGPFALAAPTPLLFGPDRFRLAPLVINGLPGERVELAGDLSLHPLSGNLRGAWNRVNLARTNLWLSGSQIDGESSGNLSLRLLPGEGLIVSGRADAKGNLVSDGRRLSLERVAATLDGDGRGLRAGLDLNLSGGAGEAHLLFNSDSPTRLALPAQGDLTLQLSGLDLALLRPFLPAELLVEGRLAGVVTGKLLPGKKLDLKGNAALTRGHLDWRAQEQELDASLDQAELAFSWHGGYPVDAKAASALKLTGRARASGAYTGNGQRIALSRCALTLDADQHEMRAGLDLALEGGGTLRGAFTSGSPAGLALPETGELTLAWGGINPTLLKPWLPGALDLTGEFAGQASGKLLPGKHLEMAGEADFSQGKAKWQGGSGEMNANLRSASLSFNWHGETLQGKLLLELSQYGKAQGEFILPVPARIPVAVDSNGALQGKLSGKVQELGFLTAVFPGLVQESHGDLDLDLRLAGIWSAPRLTGSLQLSKAGAYLPTAGIRVSELQLLARLEGDQIRIDNFKALSGAGHLEGTLLVRLKGWEVEGFSGSLSGERFQTVYLPELQLTTSPKLSFEGIGEKVTVSGELGVPEMLITGPPVRSIVTTSRDVIMEGAPAESTAKKFPLVLDGKIHVVLGDKVRVKASGIDAQLGGGMDLVLKGVDNITSSGEIRVVKGSYKAYGLDLDIVRGRLYYVNEPVDQPTLDILALTKVGDVRAGVTVAGFLSAPVVKLYSEPSMPDVDILAYMVLGHPMGASSDQGGMMAMAASSLFSFGQSESLQEQIKARLGLSYLGLQTVDTSSAGLMGYKEIPVTPTGTAQKPVAGQSLLTVGKYLTPKLYLSYGRSLVTGGSLFMLRYDIKQHWQLETQSGSESGADLYYKLEFN
jgi:translocation and assembly module TamB